MTVDGGAATRPRSWTPGAGLLAAPALLVLLLLTIVPVLTALWSSLHEGTGDSRTWAGLANYRALWADGEARESLVFTLVFVGVSVPLELALGTGLALALHRGGAGLGLLRAAALVPWALPTVVSSWMWLSILDGDRGILNGLVFGERTEDYVTFLAVPAWARAAVIAADVWKTTPFAALLVLAGLQGIPREVLEAARVDGAGALRRFWSVTLPLLRPALLLAALFRTIDAIRVFDLVYVMTRARSGTSVLQYLAYQRLFVEGDPGTGNAVAAVVFGLAGAFAIATVRIASPGAEGAR